MYLTHEIIDAIRAAVGDKFGGQRLFAMKIGTSCANVSRWLNGKNHRISDETWRKLKPHIEKFLHHEDRSSQKASSETPRKNAEITINVAGVSCEHIAKVLRGIDYLTEEQKRDLIAKIFYDNTNTSGIASVNVSGKKSDS